MTEGKGVVEENGVSGFWDVSQRPWGVASSGMAPDLFIIYK